MTLAAATLLDEAFAVYVKVAGFDDSTGVSLQTPSWQPPSTPYDFAAELCKSLIPHAYNWPVEDHARTDAAWGIIVDALEIIGIETMLSATRSDATIPDDQRY